MHGSRLPKFHCLDKQTPTPAPKTTTTAKSSHDNKDHRQKDDDDDDQKQHPQKSPFEMATANHPSNQPPFEPTTRRRDHDTAIQTVMAT